MNVEAPSRGNEQNPEQLEQRFVDRLNEGLQPGDEPFKVQLDNGDSFVKVARDTLPAMYDKVIKNIDSPYGVDRTAYLLFKGLFLSLNLNISVRQHFQEQVERPKLKRTAAYNTFCADLVKAGFAEKGAAVRALVEEKEGRLEAHLDPVFEIEITVVRTSDGFDLHFQDAYTGTEHVFPCPSMRDVKQIVEIVHRTLEPLEKNWSKASPARANAPYFFNNPNELDFAGETKDVALWQGTALFSSPLKVAETLNALYTARIPREGVLNQHDLAGGFTGKGTFGNGNSRFRGFFRKGVPQSGEVSYDEGQSFHPFVLTHYDEAAKAWVGLEYLPKGFLGQSQWENGLIQVKWAPNDAGIFGLYQTHKEVKMEDVQALTNAQARTLRVEKSDAQNYASGRTGMAERRSAELANLSVADNPMPDLSVSAEAIGEVPELIDSPESFLEALHAEPPTYSEVTPRAGENFDVLVKLPTKEADDCSRVHHYVGPQDSEGYNPLCALKNIEQYQLTKGDKVYRWGEDVRHPDTYSWVDAKGRRCLIHDGDLLCVEKVGAAAEEVPVEGGVSTARTVAATEPPGSSTSAA